MRFDKRYYKIRGDIGLLKNNEIINQKKGEHKDSPLHKNSACHRQAPYHNYQLSIDFNYQLLTINY